MTDQNPLDDELIRANLRAAVTFAVSSLVLGTSVLAYYLPLIRFGTPASAYLLAPAVLAFVVVIVANRRFEIIKDLHDRFEPRSAR
jgi:hypothetical protein